MIHALESVSRLERERESVGRGSESERVSGTAWFRNLEMKGSGAEGRSEACFI